MREIAQNNCECFAIPKARDREIKREREREREKFARLCNDTFSYYFFLLVIVNIFYKK